RVDFVAALAGLYLSVGEYEKAVPVYRQALAIDPYEINAQVGLAGALVCLAQYDDAIALLETASKRRPGALDIRMGLFQACHDSGRSEAARGHLQAILKRDANHAQAFYSMGLLDIENGALEDGEKAIRQAIACAPDFTEAYTVLADLQRFESENDDIFAMRELYGRCPQDSIERMHMAFALAKVNDDLKRYDDAFSMMQEANAIRHQFSRYDEAAELARMQQIIDGCSADVLAEHSGVVDAAPVFVLGMPRSGTSLVEQILAAHPDVCSCGENAMFSDAIAGGDPLSVSQWTGRQCQAAAEAYLQRLRQRSVNALKFTDKTLNLIVHIGSIARLLPRAKIIYVQRNALDTCLSIYKNNITGDLFDYGHDLGELGCYYRACEQLMAHWSKVLPSGMLVKIDYEQLVAEAEQQSRLLVEACGLDWHPACLDFQHATNRVLTASMTQVRQPVYTRSVGAAHHYQKYLKTLVDALA
ncbi:MAG: tetratricopeptide repeat protein, partial [Mariprofundaceae bacterium]